MKLVTYKASDKEQLGVFVGSHLYNLHDLHKGIPNNMLDFLQGGGPVMELAKNVVPSLKSGHSNTREVVFYELLAPVPHPVSCRDAYAFRQHVLTARKNRGLEMIPEFDQFPVFYFTNHMAIAGPGDIECMPDHFERLDFELEVAIVIGKQGRNIMAEEADDYIAGYMIMNDLSARKLQNDEMLLNLGPAKGKDFCTIIGPWLVTSDELESHIIPTKEGHTGKQYDLSMRCWVNNKMVSEGNLKDMNWTFAEIIERASYGVDLYPGDVIGSGTVGSGCFLELNGTGRLMDASWEDTWLKNGDLVEMEVACLGHLSNTIKQINTDWSILDRKKILENH